MTVPMPDHTDPVTEVAWLNGKSIKAGLDNPPPRAKRKRRKPPLADASTMLPMPVTVTAADPAVWKEATKMADASGIPRRNLVIGDDGSVTILNSRPRRG